MCDYSLEMYQSRPAQAGETYTTHRFASGSLGFVAPANKDTAVCMACDTRLQLTKLPEQVQSMHGLKPTEDVVFVRIEEGPYHDGVRFENGKVLTLQQLGPNVEAVMIDSLVRPVDVGAKKAVNQAPSATDRQLVDA